MPQSARTTFTLCHGVSPGPVVWEYRAPARQSVCQPGELIAERDLERVPLVRRGQIVEVLSRFGSVTVNTAAKVSEDGDYGELVTLHMPGRRKVRIVGRVTGPRRVQVGEWETPGPNGTVLADGGWR